MSLMLWLWFNGLRANPRHRYAQPLGSSFGGAGTPQGVTEGVPCHTARHPLRPGVRRATSPSGGGKAETRLCGSASPQCNARPVHYIKKLLYHERKHESRRRRFWPCAWSLLWLLPQLSAALWLTSPIPMLRSTPSPPAMSRSTCGKTSATTAALRSCCPLPAPLRLAL